MNWFQKLIRRLYMRYCNDEMIDDLNRLLSEYHEEIVYLRARVADASSLLKSTRDALARYDGCVPLPSEPTPEALKVMLAKIAEKEKARQPVDCTDLYKALVDLCSPNRVKL